MSTTVRFGDITPQMPGSCSPIQALFSSCAGDLNRSSWVDSSLLKPSTSILNKGWLADAVGAGGWVISNIIGRPRQPKTVEQFMKGDVAGATPGGAYLPLILAGGVALIVVVAMLRR